MPSLASQPHKKFLKVAEKKVSRTDIEKDAYVINKEQKEIMVSAGIKPGFAPSVTEVELHVLYSSTILHASYYGSRREGSGRALEYRMGRHEFINWIKPDDNLIMATDGEKIFVHKISDNSKKPLQDITQDDDTLENIYENMDTDALRKRAEAAKGKPGKREAKTTQYDRDPAVRAFVILRSKHHCERTGCDYEGFKKTDGTKYIQVHHIIPLAEDGEDSIMNAIALCPNCHAEAHFCSEKDNLAKIFTKHIIEKNKKK